MNEERFHVLITDLLIHADDLGYDVRALVQTAINHWIEEEDDEEEVE